MRTDEERNAYIASLVRERETYADRGNQEGVQECEAELRRVAPSREPARGVRRTG